MTHILNNIPEGTYHPYQQHYPEGATMGASNPFQTRKEPRTFQYHPVESGPVSQDTSYANQPERIHSPMSEDPNAFSQRYYQGRDTNEQPSNRRRGAATGLSSYTVDGAMMT